MNSGVHFRIPAELLVRVDATAEEQDKSRTDVLVESLWSVFMPGKRYRKIKKLSLVDKMFGRKGL